MKASAFCGGGGWLMWRHQNVQNKKVKDFALQMREIIIMQIIKEAY